MEGATRRARLRARAGARRDGNKRAMRAQALRPSLPCAELDMQLKHRSPAAAHLNVSRRMASPSPTYMLYSWAPAQREHKERGQFVGQMLRGSEMRV